MKDSAAGTLYIQHQQMEAELYRVLVKYGFRDDKARTCAQIFTLNSLEGVYTHGVNRFPRFITYVQEGQVKPDGEPVCVHSMGSMEQWNGQSGPGPLNALFCTDRAMTLAAAHGMGCIAIAYTNHWMRGGTYGWHAARKGFVFIGWTNTTPNMPAWGAVDNKLGNNPLVIAVPYEKDAIVLDMAMSQYSFGAMELSQMKGETLPVPGGYNKQGELSREPSEILETRRTLPAGYWKGAGLSLLLDILATTLSGGLSASRIGRETAECNISQVFIAIDLSKLSHFSTIDSLIRQIIDDYHQSQPEVPGKKIVYPGERIASVRDENLKRGIPVLQNVWQQVLKL